MGALQNITDRALRYRAQNAIPPGEKRCVFCGGKPKASKSRPGLEVAHLDGHEENNSPDNLAWTCRPCNVLVGNALRKAGMGRKTVQFNPTKSGGAANVGEWVQAVGAIGFIPRKGAKYAGSNYGISSAMSASDAVAMVKATPHNRRVKFAAQLRRHNPFFSPSLRASDMTPAHGGIAKHSAGRRHSSAKKASRPAAASKVVDVDADKLRKHYERGGTLAEFLARDPGLKKRNPALFDRCVKAVQAKGGDVNAYAVCSAAGTRGNPAYLVVDPEVTYRTYRAATLDAARHKAAKVSAKAHLPVEIRTAPVGDDPFGKRVETIGGNPASANVTTAKHEKEIRAYIEQKRAVGWNAEQLYRAIWRRWGYQGQAKDGAVLLKMSGGMERFQINRARKNPAAAAAEVFEEFHGYEPTEIVTVKKQVHHHKHLASAGELRGLVVKGVDGRHHVIRGFKGALLCFNEAKNQLFVEGGDQSINLEDYKIRKPHEIETLGKVVDIDYHTTKTHLGDEGGTATYQHRFRTTNENGEHVVVTIARYPDLIYRVLDEQLEFSGGSYTIRREGIDV